MAFFASSPPPECHDLPWMTCSSTLAPPPVCPARKVESFNAEAAGTLELDSAAERHAVLADPLARLEHVGLDQARASEARAMVGALRRDSTARYK